jgi:LPXTG-motif cell wall-anchored protein
MDNMLAYTIVGSLAVIGGVAGIVLGRRKKKKPADVQKKENRIPNHSKHPVLNPDSVLFEDDLKTVKHALEELSNQIDAVAVEHVKESSPSKIVNKTEEIKGRIKVLKKKKKDKVKAKNKKTVKGK